jgi:hypothetical protein
MSTDTEQHPLAPIATALLEMDLYRTLGLSLLAVGLLGIGAALGMGWLGPRLLAEACPERLIPAASTCVERGRRLGSDATMVATGTGVGMTALGVVVLEVVCDGE